MAKHELDHKKVSDIAWSILLLIAQFDEQGEIDMNDETKEKIAHYHHWIHHFDEQVIHALLVHDSMGKKVLEDIDLEPNDNIVTPVLPLVTEAVYFKAALEHLIEQFDIQKQID